jgi:purine-binding chemotaxis protein CheW
VSGKKRGGKAAVPAAAAGAPAPAREADIPFGSLAHYESATEEIYRRDYGDLVQIRAGQREFLTFRLGDELYAVDLRGILEVTRPTAITPVPFSPAWVLGVMMLRGSVVPIFHVGKMLDLDVDGRIEPAERILLVSRKENPVGLLVDEVLEVVSVPDESLGPVPPTVHGPRAEFVTGVARKGNELFVLLNYARVANVSPESVNGADAAGRKP